MTKTIIQLLAYGQLGLILIIVSGFTVCLLVTEDTATKSATAVVLLVARHRITATGRIEFLAELADWVFPDTVRSIFAIGRTATTASFATFPVLLVRMLSSFHFAS